MLTAYIKIIEWILTRDVFDLAAYTQHKKGKVCVRNQSVACVLSPHLLFSEYAVKV